MLRAATLCCAVLLVPGLALAQKDASATKRTEQFIAALLKVKPDDGKLTKADRAANEKVFSELDGYFDWDHLVNAPVQPRIAKFSAAQKAEYQKKFKELVRLVAYPDSGSFFKKAKYELSAPKEQGEVVVVSIDANVVKDDLQTTVDLHWKQTPEGLRIQDVYFDGDSLVADYMNQFSRVIDKEGVKGFIAKIDKRRAELEAPAKK